MSCQGPLWSPPPQTQDVTPRSGALLSLLLGQMAPSVRRSHQMPGPSSHAPPLILSKSWLFFIFFFWLFFQTASRTRPASSPPAPALPAALSPWQCGVGVPHKTASSSSSDASTQRKTRGLLPPAPLSLPSVAVSPPVCQPSCSQTTPPLPKRARTIHSHSIYPHPGP